MRQFLLISMLVFFATCCFAGDIERIESEILAWSQERLEQHEQANQVGPAAELRKKIAQRDHEWLAVSLAVSYSIEKRVNEGIKGDRPNTPVLDQNIGRVRGRLVSLGQYIVFVNR